MQNVLSPGNKIGVLLTKPNVTNVRFYGLGAMEGVLRGFLEPTVPGPQGSDRLRRPGRPGGRGTGQGALQAHGRRRAAGPGLPEALGGPVGRGEVPAEAGGQTREEAG